MYKLTGVNPLDGEKKLSSQFRISPLIKTHTRIQYYISNGQECRDHRQMTVRIRKEEERMDRISNYWHRLEQYTWKKVLAKMPSTSSAQRKLKSKTRWTNVSVPELWILFNVKKQISDRIELLLGLVPPTIDVKYCCRTLMKHYVQKDLLVPLKLDYWPHLKIILSQRTRYIHQAEERNQDFQISEQDMLSMSRE